MLNLSPRIAAVVPGNYGGIDDLVAGFAISQIHQGRRVRGLVQETQSSLGSKRLTLVDLDNGTIYPITQYLGKHSASCRIDTAGIAEASAVMLRIGVHGADLAIFNRFAALEAQGGGFADEMLYLMTLGIPVLTIVPNKFLAHWHKFTGGLSVELAPNRLALETWFIDSHRNVTVANAERCRELSQANHS